MLLIGNNNHHAQYLMNEKQVTTVSKEKDLRVVILSDLKPFSHYSQVVKTVINYWTLSHVPLKKNLRRLH